MTDATAAALIAQIPAVIASITAAVIAFASLRKSSDNGKKADATNNKQDVLIEKAVEIHTQTNGQMSKVTSALAVSP
jgi:type III secretory pathway component EscV